MDEHKDCELELAKIKEEAEQYLNNWKRAKADYANLERQVERQREDWAHFATLACVQAFLPVYESLLQATAAHADDSGLARIRDQMKASLKGIGVEPMDTIGKIPDPMLHEVLSAIDQESAESGTIVQEVQPGFTLHGKVLRVAKVIIAK